MQRCTTCRQVLARRLYSLQLRKWIYWALGPKFCSVSLAHAWFVDSGPMGTIRIDTELEKGVWNLSRQAGASMKHIWLDLLLDVDFQLLKHNSKVRWSRRNFSIQMSFSFENFESWHRTPSLRPDCLQWFWSLWNFSSLRCEKMGLCLQFNPIPLGIQITNIAIELDFE